MTACSCCCCRRHLSSFLFLGKDTHAARHKQWLSALLWYGLLNERDGQVRLR
uniref:Uncharacterized protein n=1 Tax=Arundo donax TaxID=35708 RepID=A0A0A9AQH4_ARUDO